MPDVITRYFQADARRDTDAIVALFTEDAVVSAAASQGEPLGPDDDKRLYRERPPHWDSA